MARGRAADSACPDWPLLGSGPRPIPAQAEGPSARRAGLGDPADGPALHLRVGRVPASDLRRAVLAAGCPARTVHHASQPRPGASGTRAGRAGRSSAGGPAGLRRGTDDLVTQGHGIARSGVLRRSPTGSTCGRASAEPWKHASPAIATACAILHPAGRCRRPRQRLPPGRWATRHLSVDGRSARRKHMPLSTSTLTKVTHAGRLPGTWAGASTPCCGTRTPRTGRTPSVETGPVPADWTSTSPPWSDDSPRDAPTSPTSTANSLPTTLPSPTRWSAPTPPPSAGAGRRAAEAADGAKGDRVAHPTSQCAERERPGRPEGCPRTLP